MTSPAQPALTGADILRAASLDHHEMYQRIAEFLMARYALGKVMAGRLFGQAVCLVHYAATHPDAVVAASAEVDFALDALIACTPQYGLLCAAYGDGAFLHHLHRLPGRTATAPDGAPVPPPAESATLMHAAGYLVEDDLWPEVEDAGAWLFSPRHLTAPYRQPLIAPAGMKLVAADCCP